MLSRRGLITGLVSLVAAPAIVRAASIMPVKAMPVWTVTPDGGFIYPFHMADYIAWIDQMLREDARKAFDIFEARGHLCALNGARLRHFHGPLTRVP